MDLQQLIDPFMAGFVVLGTIAATVARSGWVNSVETMRQIRRLSRGRFNLAQNRAELAVSVKDMRKDGIIRGRADPMSDREFSATTAALVRHRSIEALQQEHMRFAQERAGKREQAINTLAEAGNLSPVFGLAGTLLSLSQLPTTELASEGAMMGFVAKAVVSTLYGLLCGHLIFLPLGAAIERRGTWEEAERDKLTDWLVDQLKTACPSCGDDENLRP